MWVHLPVYYKLIGETENIVQKTPLEVTDETLYFDP